MDAEAEDRTIKPGEWRALAGGIQTPTIGTIQNVRGSRHQNDAIQMRKALKEYVNSEDGRCGVAIRLYKTHRSFFLYAILYYIYTVCKFSTTTKINK